MVGMDQSLAPLPLSAVQTVDLEGSATLPTANLLVLHYTIH